MTTKLLIDTANHVYVAFDQLPPSMHATMLKEYSNEYTVANLVISGDVTQVSRKMRKMMIDAYNVAGYVKEIMSENIKWQTNTDILEDARKRYTDFYNALTPIMRDKWYN
jgi:hypothetical protein